MNRINKLMACLLIFSLLFMTVSSSFTQEKQKQETVLCPKCSTKNPATAKFCSKCGTKLPERITPPGSKEEIPKPKLPILREEPTVKTKPGEEIPPAVTEEAVPVTAEELKAKAIYDHGAVLFDNGVYHEAIVTFSQIVRDYPSTRYAETASLMIKACYRIVAVEKKKEVEQKKKGGISPIVSGCLGGILGVVVISLLITALLLSD